MALQTHIIETRKLTNGQLLMRQLLIKPGRKIVACSLNYSARFIMYANKKACERDHARHYQACDDVPDEVVFEIMSTQAMTNYGFERPPKYEYNLKFLRKPFHWHPVELANPLGIYYCIIECRCGNSKFKPNIIVTLTTDEIL